MFERTFFFTQPHLFLFKLSSDGIEAAVHVVYRNCSGLISPPAGCGTGEEWIYSIEEEITSLVEDRVPSLSTWEYETRDLEGTACYCEQDGCNDEEIITDENGQGGNSGMLYNIVCLFIYIFLVCQRIYSHVKPHSIDV